MDYFEDHDNFTLPYKEALKSANRNVLAAGNPVRGAQERVSQSLLAKNHLLQFRERHIETVENGAFAELPRLWHRMRPIQGCHHLTLGPWRGLFLVDPERELAIAILFSQHPHRIDDLLALLGSHRTENSRED